MAQCVAGLKNISGEKYGHFYLRMQMFKLVLLGKMLLTSHLTECKYKRYSY